MAKSLHYTPKIFQLNLFDKVVAIQQVMEIEGFAEISAKTYVDNYEKFMEHLA